MSRELAQWVSRLLAAERRQRGTRKSELTRADLSWALLTGTIDQRLMLATAIADQLLTWRSTFADPLGP